METPKVQPTRNVINQEFENCLVDGYKITSVIEVMSGTRRARIAQLRKESETNEAKKPMLETEINKLVKDSTFKVVWDLKMLPIETLIKECFKAQSPIVALQALLRPLGDEKLNLLAQGKESKFDDDRYTIKEGIITVDCAKFFESKKRESASIEDKALAYLRKLNPMFAKMTDEQLKQVLQNVPIS